MVVDNLNDERCHLAAGLLTHDESPIRAEPSGPLSNPVRAQLLPAARPQQKVREVPCTPELGNALSVLATCVPSALCIRRSSVQMRSRSRESYRSSIGYVT